MAKVKTIPGLNNLWEQTLGNSDICVAVLDGLVDSSHPCFVGADLSQIPTLVNPNPIKEGLMYQHGTHVASVIFGQHGSPVEGIAPQCKGLIIPIFCDKERKLSQLDLSRAIEQAVQAGAHIINISGGQLTDYGEADDWLQQAVALCQQHNVLIVAAAGNNGCDCLHVPAALPAALAVGAMNDNGKPIDYSNWGSAYQTQGILAPGEKILGAKTGGGIIELSGTSFATPIVTGVAALLLSLQKQWGEQPNPQKVRAALLKSATPCDFPELEDKARCLVGKLNILGAIEKFKGGVMSEEQEALSASGCGCQTSATEDAVTINESSAGDIEAMNAEIAASAEEGITEAATGMIQTPTAVANPTVNQMPPGNMPVPNPTNYQNYIQPYMTPNTPMSYPVASSVTPSQAPSDINPGPLVYALGTLGYDFGTEARRDSFKQLMPGVTIDNTIVPANPYDARQMVDYLGDNLSEAKSLIWTLNLELTPIYAIEPKGAFARDVYAVLQELLSGQIQPEEDENYVERVSIPGILTGRTVKLFSGQIVPVIEPQNTRGLYGWKVNTLIGAALDTIGAQVGETEEDNVRRTLGGFLNRIYYDFRNLGTTSQDRALNFATTNAFQAATTIATAVAEAMELDTITVEKSPFCRVDSDCWDVKLKFFDPENNRRAKKVFRFTIDVSDIIPVTLGKVRTWSTAY
ncbi:S8 family peptidase [Gloeothece verrucosa]|uniref:Peptidase S8 and S53 subtilisin kexin sedolisin n=1 Tax=Gloeothece verrucosa (strain PCC 7822) TaxID=497965 RepID=E0UMX5_GLOV7|nr:PatA/PatG family cyanobactin maturation protease [Gloeothece verrucosa]ADN18305.1 peptidase S8 and S53 subtilisin kexin sedolisin [Gloeothece verrucosa PCC 7822]